MMDGASTAIVIVALIVVLLVARTILALGAIAWRIFHWLIEQPEGVVGAAGRLVALGLLLHTVGLL